MEAFAYKLLQIGEGGSIVLSWVIMVASAAVAVALTKPQWKLGRAAYFLSVGFVFLLSGMTSLLALGVADAIKGGYLAILVGVIYGLLIPIGGMAGIFAAARSIDAYGKRDKWVSGFIPLLNLVLLFARPQEQVKTGPARILGNTAMVILGFLLLGVGKGFGTMTEQSIDRSVQNVQADPELQEKALQYEVENNGIENVLKEAALAVPVPQKVDSITTLKAVEVEGETFRYVYEISDEEVTLGESWNHIMMSRWCTSEDFKPMYGMGATVAGRYVDAAGNTLAELAANPSLCSTWNETLDAELTAAAKSVKGPKKVDEITTLTGASYVSGTYSFHYTISVLPPDELWKGHIERSWCKSPEFKQLMEVGLNVRGVYVSENGAPVGEVSINKAICGLF